MCVIGIAWHASDRYPLIVAANRDERHERPTSAADWWPDQPGILSGRDLVAGGTWLGVSSTGRFAAVTNVFDNGLPSAALSRGKLVSDFLVADGSGDRYVSAIEPSAYGPFNLLLVDGSGLLYASNRDIGGALPAGIHAFSNNRPGEDWPKVGILGNALRKVSADGRSSPEAGETAKTHDAASPPSRTEVDRLASGLLDALCGVAARGTRDTAPESVFIVGSVFGTRCSTVLVVDSAGRAIFVERRFAATGDATGTSRFEFELPAFAASI